MTFPDFITFVIFGIIAGFAGTVAMTLSELAELWGSGRPLGFTAGRGAAFVLGFDFEKLDDYKKAILNNVVRWAYGMLWGAPFVFVSLFEPDIVRAAGTYFLIVWGQAAILLPIFGITPPVWDGGVSRMIASAAHHAVYAAVVAVVARFLLGFFL